ncbi:Fe-Mn family superoxide dismutase [Polaromonas sp. JS666]|uniref:Fe-Mn family superoxide dismutase n=1 Tax=Polaromonas sp. (strain JS666 / ATCC BAA-500) TaxID=296591 RepID=UPI0000464FFA|nr:Fe-Mn family superoxide dismutase [Polaromonas sp. JS666]ABE44419.1 manganese and iron superoxide dismutase [Polaromonas sp. JS666]
MDIQLKPLSLDPAKLDGLSEQLLRSHYDNNYTGAAKRLNAIRGQLSQLAWDTTPVFTINGLKREELIAANSVYLHELYFENLGGDGVLPSNGLSIALTRDFGSVERWRSEFTALAKAMGGGSGWAILNWSPREGRLVNQWAADHTHLLAGATPILALDMYEHAYHLDFGAKAAAYVDAFMRNINWNTVYPRYGAAVKASALSFGVEPSAVNQATAQLIDVRRAETFADANDMITGARYADPADVSGWVGTLDPERPVVVYCLHGLDIGRSTALSLRARGVSAQFMEGGIEAWRAVQLPLVPKAAA